MTDDVFPGRLQAALRGPPSGPSPGRLMLWLHRPRGGYGYLVPIPAVVVSHAGTWVVIEVARRDGSVVKRRVDVASLRSTK